MPYYKLAIILLAPLFFQNCHQSPQLENFDAATWQEDPNGCQGSRLAQLQLLVNQQEALLGWSENQIISYLGDPDYRELYVRNQKFLIYYLEPPVACGEIGKNNPLRLYLRMDALGDSREVSLRNQ